MPKSSLIAATLLFLICVSTSPLLYAGEQLPYASQIASKVDSLSKELAKLRSDVVDMQVKQDQLASDLREFITASKEKDSIPSKYGIPVLGFVGVILTIMWGIRQYKLSYFTQHWAVLIEFLGENPEFMDPNKTKEYKTHFQGTKLVQYELVARRCLGYLDDMYFMNSQRNFKRWFKGSISLLAGRHRQWLEDNRGAYDERFLNFITKSLENKQN